MDQLISYLLIVLGLVGTGSILPIPEEVFIIGAGIASQQGGLNPVSALGACFIGCLLGDCVMYAIGHHFGRRLLEKRAWFARVLTPERERNVERMFRQHGLKAFFLARFLVGVRGPFYITAGILRISFIRFLLTDMICAAAVIGVFFGLSYFFADRINAWWEDFHEVGLWVTVFVALLALAAGFYFLWRQRRRVARIRRRWLERPRRKRGSGNDEPVSDSRPLV